MNSYEEILKLTRQLPAEQRLLLADTLLAEELGFGMWRDRTEMADVTAYVERLRAAQMRTPAGRQRRPEEFLRWVESDDDFRK
jgi:hypothetical protein